MPSRIQIREEADGAKRTLEKYMTAFEKRSRRNLLVYYSGFLYTDEGVSIHDGDTEGFMSALYKMDKSKGLDLFLHTPGGTVSATEAIGDYLRSVFKGNIHCYVPHLAFSCGTLLAMACQRIYMGRHSSLGPIDPALGKYRADAVVEEFERAKADIERNPNLALFWQQLLGKYPATIWGESQKASEMARNVSERWLMDGMLADVEDEKKKKEMLDRITTLFASHQDSKMHDRHISAEVAATAGLTVFLIEEDKPLQESVLSLHHAITHFMQQNHLAKMISNDHFIGKLVPMENK